MGTGAGATENVPFRLLGRLSGPWGSLGLARSAHAASKTRSKSPGRPACLSAGVSAARQSTFTAEERRSGSAEGTAWGPAGIKGPSPPPDGRTWRWMPAHSAARAAPEGSKAKRPMGQDGRQQCGATSRPVARTSLPRPRGRAGADGGVPPAHPAPPRPPARPEQIWKARG